MAKIPIDFNFAQGLDQKTDPKQVAVGKFLGLNNTIFTKGGLQQKRNGYGTSIASLPAPSKFLTTFGGNLTAIGNSFQALASGPQLWISKGNFQPISLSTIPIVRNALSQTQCDSVMAANGLVCTVYSESNAGTADYSYSIQDSVTGQNVVPQSVVPVTSGTVTGSPRVFLLGGFFIIAFTNVITAVSHLQYIAISTANPTMVTTNADIAAAYTSTTTLSWDGVVVGNQLFFAYYTTSGGSQIKLTYLNTAFQVASPVTFSGSVATIMSMTADLTNPANPVIYAAFWDAGGSTGNVVAIDQNLNKLMTATQWLGSGTEKNVTCTALNGAVTIAFETAAAYSYDSGIATNYIQKVSVMLPASLTTGTVGSVTTVLRSVGLASKAFMMNSKMYMLTEYSSTYQPTYFLIDINGNVVSRFAYENGGGYLTTGLPQAQVNGSTVTIPYLYKDLITSVNKTQGSSAAGIYSQTGVNLVSLTFAATTLSVSEFGNNLNVSGGILWAYDGNTLAEQNFHLFPDYIEATWSASGGSIHAQPDGSTNTNAYFYQVIYQWTDAQGRIFFSAPSIPISVTTTGSGTSGSITINGPNLRVTGKSNVKVIIYRWSVAQQNYYQVTSLTSPVLNSTTADSWQFVDMLADSSIIGNGLIYTTGGVVEDIGGPACTAITQFDTRLWLIDAEDQNLLWYSKEVIEGTPVELSDLFTLFISPNAGVSASTGPMRCIFPMDDKLIIFKKNALYYINGTGPDNTGANNQYSQPIFITSTVGSINQNSIVLVPACKVWHPTQGEMMTDGGLMFESDKGIWILTRSLQTYYIGAPVENSNGQNVTSAWVIPETTQVRFTLNNSTSIMFDYYYGEWGMFTIGAASATIYQDLHTLLTSTGQVLQETPGTYLDNGNPVLISWISAWIKSAALQGYQRFYWFFLLGEYLSPHFLQIQIAYDYNPSPLQQSIIAPNNFSPSTSSPFGDQPAPFGSSFDREQWKIHMKRQKCEAFQISLTEIYDPSFGVACGAGFNLSGIRMMTLVKRSSRPLPAAQTTG
jgi:hypothetical protein